MTINDSQVWYNPKWNTGDTANAMQLGKPNFALSLDSKLIDSSDQLVCCQGDFLLYFTLHSNGCCLWCWIKHDWMFECCPSQSNISVHRSFLSSAVTLIGPCFARGSKGKWNLLQTLSILFEGIFSLENRPSANLCLFLTQKIFCSTCCGHNS